MSIKDLTELILYVAPGFLALELYNSFYPGRERNQFRQVVWSIVVGLAIVTITKEVDGTYLASVLGGATSSFPQRYFIVSLFAGGPLVGGLFIAIRFVAFRLSTTTPALKWLAPDPQSIWAKVNERSNRDWAVVFLDDGSIYIGWISAYTFNPNVRDQDFLLSRAKVVDENLNTLYMIDGIGVYMNTRDVRRIEFVRGVQVGPPSG